MFDLRQRLGRKSSIIRDRGYLMVRIRGRNQRFNSVTSFVFSTAALVMVLRELTPAVMRVPTLAEAALLFLLAGFVMLWYFLMAGLALWSGFGNEVVIVGNGEFRWTRKALCWQRQFKASQSDVVNVVAKQAWIGFNNRVEFTVQGRTYSIGDGLFRDQALKIALNLQYALKQPARKHTNAPVAGIKTLDF